MGQLARFDTRGLDANERLAGWGAFISSAPNRLTTMSCGGVPFAGSVEMATFGGLRIVHVEATPHRLEKPAGQAGDGDMMRIVIQVRGRAILSQGGQDVVLEPGCWAAWSTDRAHVITNLTDVEQFALLMPIASVGVRLGDILRQAGACLGNRPGVGQLLPGHVARLFAQVEAIGPSLDAEMVDIVAHLVRLALTEHRDSAGRTSLRETMRGRIADYVRHHLRDPDMSLDRVAAHFGCSKRNIHKAFSASGTTLSQFLWIERLERCRDALASPQLAGRSITEIAFGWGFNNSTHFSKAFKARFGVAPGAWRAQVLTAGARLPLHH